jgi:AcrR family transcriptional regulator
MVETDHAERPGGASERRAEWPRTPQRQRILQIAAALFAERGYDATSIAELGDAVGLGRGALYHHIQSKERLLYEISRERPLEMVEFGRALLAEDIDPEEKFHRLSRRIIGTLAANLPGATVFLSDSRALTGEHRREIVALRAEVERIVAALLEEGVEQGRFRPTHPLVVKGILGFFNHAHVWLRPNGELSPDEIGDLFADFLLRALEADAPRQRSGERGTRPV